MNLFLCSHFSSVGSFLKEQIMGKKVLFIPTASIHEDYTGYVGSARKLFKKLDAKLIECDISNEKIPNIKEFLEDSDVIYFTGGNSFFLIDQLRKTGVDVFLKQELKKGKLFVGESAGAIVCAPTISYIEIMDSIPVDYSQSDYKGLNIIDFYVLSHYLTAPFKKITEQIMEKYSNLDIKAINNSQAIIIKDGKREVITYTEN